MSNATPTPPQIGTASRPGPPKKMNWGPAIAILLLLLLGVWVALAPDVPQPRREGSQRAKLSIGPLKGVLEWVPSTPPSGSQAVRTPETFVIHYRDGASSTPLSRPQIESLLGPGVLDRITASGNNWLFRALNVTGWAGVAWVVVGFGGQIVFSGRWVVQWFISERNETSSVPVSFWWMSLFGSVLLFAYFVWRNDVVGAMGQSTGVVIYARNIELIRKQAARASTPA
ncbi:MAG TPA: lipid-A-disaccharide synthase N-terminal domain-containing protein [Phycisphaerales bacterium]|nr:lipid-A-disaccharide synthase N-terminal domain-containing protein [Phycisphaerales bacterium]